MCENQPPLYPPPPPAGQVKGLFNTHFPGLNLRYWNAVARTCDWHSGSHSSPTSSTPTSPPSATSRLEHRVSVFLFSQSLLSLAGCLLPNCASSQSCFKLCFLLVGCHESSSLFGLLAPHLVASVVAHWGGNRTAPWPLVWDSWPPLSCALPDQLPPPDNRENHLIWVDSILVIPLAWCRMSLECPVGTNKFPTTLMIPSLQKSRNLKDILTLRNTRTVTF